jgi:hypothetical protein
LREEDRVIFELKALGALRWIYEAKLLIDIRRRDKRAGMLMNVDVRRFREKRDSPFRADRGEGITAFLTS